MTGLVRVLRLAIDRMPGFRGGGPSLDGASEGVNLVGGSNGSGKTTLARAIRMLLFDGADARTGLRAGVRVDDTTWDVSVDGTRPAVWTSPDGEPRPDVPPWEESSAYMLSLHDLLLDDDTDFAERIRIETAGGFDVRAAAKAVGFGEASRPMKLAGALDGARSELAEAETTARALQEKVDRKGRDEVRLQRRDPLRAEEAALEAAIRRARARGAFDEARRVRDAFSERGVLARMRGDEVERMEEWVSTEERLTRELREFEVRRAQAESTLEETGLDDGGVPGGLLGTLSTLHDEARDLERTLGQRREELAAAADIAREAQADALPEVDLDALDGVIRTSEELRARREQLRTREAELDEAALDEAAPAEAAPDGTTSAGSDTPVDRDETRRRLDQLERWASAPSMDDAAERGRRLILGVSIMALLVGLAAAGLALTRTPLDGWLLGIGSVVLVLGVAGLVLLPRSRGSDREAVERDIGDAPWGPDDWTREAVGARMEELRRELVEAERRRRRRDDRERIRAERAALDTDEAEFATVLGRHRDALGLEGEVSTLRLHQVATTLATRAEAARTRDELRARVDEVTDQRSKLLVSARDRLEPWGYEVEDVRALGVAIETLRSRVEAHREASRVLRDMGERIAERREQLGGITTARRALLERVGLEELDPDDAADRLRDAHTQLDDWRAAVREVDVAERDLRSAKGALETLIDQGNAAAVDLYESDPPPAPAELERRLVEVREELETLDELSDRVREIHGALENAGTSRAVEQAQASVDAAERALEQQLAMDIEAEVGDELAAWVHEQAAEQNLPEVFLHARERLAGITRGRWDLRMDDGDPPAFRAFDTELRLERSLDELSAGTRVQLLLAVRMAFVRTMERDLTLPLLMDEVLANCDDERADAIIAAALELAREGRQLFYFTAQPDEIAKWRAALETTDLPWAETILDAPEGTGSAAFAWDGDAGAFRSHPAPEGDDHDGYGRRLAVPGWDVLDQPVTSLHVWHLLDDPELIHGVLEYGIETWGPLETFAARAEPPASVGRAYEQGRPWAVLAGRFADYWRIGRGRPLDPGVLQETDAITDTFYERVVGLAEELEWDGEALVQALGDGELARFRGDKAEELRAHLIERGYMSAETPLTEADVLRRLRADADGLGLDVALDDLAAWVARLSRGGARMDATGQGDSS